MVEPKQDPTADTCASQVLIPVVAGAVAGAVPDVAWEPYCLLLCGLYTCTGCCMGGTMPSVVLKSGHIKYCSKGIALSLLTAEA